MWNLILMRTMMMKHKMTLMHLRNPPSTSEEKHSTPDHNQNDIKEEIDTQSDTPSVAKCVKQIEEPSSKHTVPATPPFTSPESKNPRWKIALGSAMESESLKTSSELSDVLWHPSDLSVASHSFDTLPASELEKMSKEQLDIFCIKIVTVFNGNANIGEKQIVVRYLETLSINSEVANIITNGPIMLVLIKMLRQSKTSALRIQLVSLIGLLIRHSTYIQDDLAHSGVLIKMLRQSKTSALRIQLVSLIGLLIRHSTYIQDDLAHSGILSSLTDSLRDQQEKVRRYSMAALGELLFYISTQTDQSKDNIATETEPNDSRSATGWQVPNALRPNINIQPPRR